MDFAIIMKLLQFLPTLITLVETLHGGTTTGAQKLSSVVGMVTAALPAAQAAIVTHPDNQPHVITAVNAIVAGLNSAGLMPSIAAPVESSAG